jgi:hypothetical protein
MTARQSPTAKPANKPAACGSSFPIFPPSSCAVEKRRSSNALAIHITCETNATRPGNVSFVFHFQEDTNDVS